MYATGYATRPIRSRRQPAGARFFARSVAVLLVAVGASIGLALAVHGGAPQVESTVVVRPGDTLWSLASGRYPSDDVRSRVDQIEQLNGLSNPVIVVGESLRLPAA